MNHSPSPLLREEIKILLKKRAVEKVQDPGTPGFYSRICLVPKKNGKLRLIIDLSLLNRYIEKVFQDGDSQVCKTIDETQRLGCLQRSDRCIPSCSDTSSVQKVSSIRLRRSGTVSREMFKTMRCFRTHAQWKRMSGGGKAVRIVRIYLP